MFLVKSLTQVGSVVEDNVEAPEVVQEFVEMPRSHG
jgi:hypothetical protein